MQITRQSDHQMLRSARTRNIAFIGLSASEEVEGKTMDICDLDSINFIDLCATVCTQVMKLHGGTNLLSRRQY